MITAEQSEYIEKQQTRALKNIYGNEHSRRKLYELSQVKPERQEREGMLQICSENCPKWTLCPPFQASESKVES